MKMLTFAVAALASVTAWAGEPCQKELKDKERLDDRVAQCQKALADYENASLAPLVPGQAEKEYLQLKANLEAALHDRRLATEAYERCRKKHCKKANLRWGCIANWEYDRCCFDNKDKDGSDKGAGKK